MIGGMVLLSLSFGSGYWVGERSSSKGALTSGYTPSSPLRHADVEGDVAHSVTTGSNTGTVSPEMKEFSENRAVLNAKMTELRNQGALTPQAIAEFQKQNADLLKRQRDLAKIIAEQNAKNPISTPAPLQIPANASPQMKTFLTEQDQLMRDQIAFMNLHRQEDPTVRQAAVLQWRQQNASRFQQLQKDSQALQQASAKPVAQTSGNPGK